MNNDFFIKKKWGEGESFVVEPSFLRFPKPFRKFGNLLLSCLPLLFTVNFFFPEDEGERGLREMVQGTN